MRFISPPPWRDTRDASLCIAGSRPEREPWNTKCLRSIWDLAYGFRNRSIFLILSSRGVPRGDAQDARASPLPPLCIPPWPCASPPPQHERLVMRKRQWATRKKVCLPKHNYNFDSNLVEPRAVDPHCFDGDPEQDPDPAQNLDADPDPDPNPGGGGFRSAKNVHPPWQNPRYAPA